MNTPTFSRPGKGPALLAVLILCSTLAVGLGAGWGLNHWLGTRTSQPSSSQATSPASNPAAPSASSPQADAASPPARPKERKPLYWYDPMVPNQHFDQPGKSPFMDMDLVPKYADEPTTDGDTDQAANQAADQAADKALAATPGLSVSGQVIQSLGVRLASVETRDMAAQVHAVGTVQLNERDVSIVQARFAGFVERAYAHAPGEVVPAGAPLADVLVPEWSGAQAEYLALRQAGEASLAQAARQRLRLLGMPASLVDRLDRTGQAQSTFTVTAPAAGVIQELVVRQGMAVSPGMTLARLNGIDPIWVEAAVPEDQAQALHAGRAGQMAQAQIELAAYPGQPLQGQVRAVLPEGSRDTRTLRLRIELPNRDGRLKAGMTAQVRIQGAARPALAVPAQAVIRTGRRALVYVAEDQASRYHPVEVRLGAESQGHIEVLEGLREGQKVVASGPFLIDSEASLQGLAPATGKPGTAPANTQGDQP